MAEQTAEQRAAAERAAERAQSQRSSGQALAAQQRTTPVAGATMAEGLSENQPVPAEGSTVIHPPLLQNVPPPAEPDKSTAEDHEKANTKTEGKPEAEQRGVTTITVESALGESRVALYERDPAHPNGEAFVGPGQQVEVARTGAVEARLNAGQLREV